MGQKINPILFRIANTSWASKYLEKKTTELSIYTKKDIEMRTFIYKFFENNQIKIYNCNISYLGKSIHIFITYFEKLKIQGLRKSSNQKQKIKHKIKWIQKYKNKIENYLSKSKKNSSKTKLSVKRFFEMENMTSILEEFFESVASFTDQNFKIFLILQKLNHRGKFFRQRSLMRLRKYQNEIYYKEGVRIFFACGTNENSAEQLSRFLASQLKNLKRRHNRFFKFIKEALSFVKQSKFAQFKGIKIKFKGRINGRPRARSTTIRIGRNISVFKISSSISYGETPSFTSNGTLGVKVWVQKKNAFLSKNL